MATEQDREPALSHASMPAGAVFLSYASEDAPAAERIANALRAAGIEVWFDKTELRGGDAWDRQIRKQIHDCALFIPIISAHSQARLEGYFRREWKLAADRTHDMAEEKAFLVPVVVDVTSERGASVPEKFHEVQWTRLTGGETPPGFVERIGKLLSPEPATRAGAPVLAGSAAPTRSARSRGRSKLALWAMGAVLGLGVAYLIADGLWVAKHSPTAPVTEKTASSTSTPPATTAAFNPPPHSIAVLPFVNMSGDKEQEYFSDGITEELLNSLSHIQELQVAGRTSSFYFKGKDVDLATIASKLNVSAVLEGSVRRSANRVRVTAQLISGATGYHLWSQTYDRSLGDILALQTEVASAVTSALKVALFADPTPRAEVGGTRNSAALDAYLRAQKIYFTQYTLEGSLAAAAGYTEAVRLDPNFALAFAARSLLYLNWNGGTRAERRGLDERAQIDAQRAIALAPDLAEGHLALAVYLKDVAFNFTRASEEFKRAVTLAPGNVRTLIAYGFSASEMGNIDAGMTASRRAVALDPLNPLAYSYLAGALVFARRYDEAIASQEHAVHAVSLAAQEPYFQGDLGPLHYLVGDFEAARAICEKHPDVATRSSCLAMTYDKLGRHADAELMLAKLNASMGDAEAYNLATIYAQWGDKAKALDRLESAMRLRDRNLPGLKMDPLLDPLHNEPRFQAIERALKFPD